MRTLKQRIEFLVSSERWRKNKLAKFISAIAASYSDDQTIDVVSALPSKGLYYVHINGQKVGSPVEHPEDCNTIARWLHQNRKEFKLCISPS